MPCLICDQPATLQCSECTRRYCGDLCATEDEDSHLHLGEMLPNDMIAVDFLLGSDKRKPNDPEISSFVGALAAKLGPDRNFVRSKTNTPVNVYSVGRIKELIGAAGLAEGDPLYANELDTDGHYWQVNTDTASKAIWRLKHLDVTDSSSDVDEEAARVYRYAHLAARTKQTARKTAPGQGPAGKTTAGKGPARKTTGGKGGKSLARLIPADRPMGPIPGFDAEAEWDESRGEMKKDVIYVHVVNDPTQSGAFDRGIDWSVVKALTETGRRVLIVLLYRRKPKKPEPELFWDPVERPEVERFALPIDKATKRIQPDDPDTERALVEILRRIGLPPDAPAPTRPAEPGTAIRDVLDTRNAVGELVRVALRETERSVIDVKLQSNARRAVVRLPKDGVYAFEDMVEILHRVMSDVQKAEYFAAERSVENMLPNRPEKSDDMFFIDERWKARELDYAATVWEEMITDRDEKVQEEAWVWLFHRLFSWSVTRRRDVVQHILQTRTDSRAAELLEFLQVPEQAVLENPRIVGYIGAIWPLDQLREAKQPANPLLELLHLSSLSTRDRLTNAVRMTVRIPDDAEMPITYTREEVPWLVDMPSDTAL